MTLSLCRGLWYPSLGDTGQCCLQEQEEPPPVSSEPFRCSLKDPHRKVQPEDSHARTHRESGDRGSTRHHRKGRPRRAARSHLKSF